MKRHYFNMIEIILAISILSIGISSVMGLFVVSMRTGAQTVSKANEPDASESVLSHIKAEIYKNRTENGWGTISVKTVASDGPIENDTIEKVGADKWNALEEDTMLLTGTTAGYYLYRQNAAVKNGTKVEYVPVFTAMVRIRKINSANITVSDPVAPGNKSIDDSEINNLKNSDGENLTSTTAASRTVFEVRISYPADAAPADRTVTTHVVEFFNDKYNRTSGEGVSSAKAE